MSKRSKRKELQARSQQGAATLDPAVSPDAKNSAPEKAGVNFPLKNRPRERVASNGGLPKPELPDIGTGAIPTE